jgi:hypothetical protein
MPTIGDRAALVQTYGHGPVFYRTLGQAQAVCVSDGCRYRGPVRAANVDQLTPSTIRAAWGDALTHLRAEGSPLLCSTCGRDVQLDAPTACPACSEDEMGIPARPTLECWHCGAPAEVTHPDGHGDQIGYCGRCEP